MGVIPDSKPSKFWMVVLDGGASPTARHTDVLTARAEATRVSNKTGNRAYVMEAVESCEPLRNVIWTDI